MKYIIIVTFILLQLALTPAYAYYYDNTSLNFVWKTPPLVCVWDSDYNRHADEALSKWQDALITEFGPEFKFPATLIKSETSFEVIQMCNINLVYIEIEYASVEDLTDENGFVKGGIMYSKISSEIWIYIYEAKGKFFPTLEDFDNMMITTTMHEIGHSLGIGHVIAENMQEKLKPWPKTIMWPFGGHDTHKTIYPQDLDAFKCLYYEATWFGNNPAICPKYDTDFPLRPDPFTGEVGLQFDLT